jgi:hypothetical protein
MSTTRPLRSCDATDGRHGSPKLDQDHIAVFQGYLVRMDKHHLDQYAEYQDQSGGTECTIEMMTHFWSEPKHARLIDADMVRCCFACATDEVLKGNMSLSRRFFLLGSYLATWLKLGKDVFLGLLAESPKIQTMIDFSASIQKMRTDRGLVLFLAEQIPCSCLDEDKKNAKQAPRTGRCWFCNSEDIKLEMKKCSQCKSAEYCSKECQLADWRGGHKKDCKGHKLAHEHKAALKAQLRR